MKTRHLKERILARMLSSPYRHWTFIRYKSARDRRLEARRFAAMASGEIGRIESVRFVTQSVKPGANGWVTGDCLFAGRVLKGAA